MRSLRTWMDETAAVGSTEFSDGVSGWCEFDLEARMPVRHIRRRAPPFALCGAHRRNRAQPHQSGRCAARNGIHQLAETDLDLLRTLRGVYLRRSLVSVEEGGRDARTKSMTRETPHVTRNRQTHSRRASRPAVLSRHLSAAVEHREIDSSECGGGYRPQLLRGDTRSAGIVRLGHCRADTFSCAAGRILSHDQLRPLAPRSYRDRGRELAAAIRPMGTGQGRQPSVDLDVANLGRFCRAGPDAGMGRLDSRWLASIAKRSTDRSSDEALATEDTVHMSIATPMIDIQEEGSHGCCEREGHRHTTYSRKLSDPFAHGNFRTRRQGGHR